MPSVLPTDDGGSKAVKDFGVGPYDALLDSGLHGEDDEEREPSGASLPDGGGSESPVPDFYLSYPQEEALQGKHASGILPGDADRPARAPSPDSDVYDAVVPSSRADGDQTARAELPDGRWPSARADYYDTTTTSEEKNSSDMWAPESTGAYVSNDPDGEGSTLPGPSDNTWTMDDFLGSLGNSWSGFVVEDQDVPRGFPSQDYEENSSWPRSNQDDDGGTILAHIVTSNAGADLGETMTRTATNLELVGQLAKDFIKEYGKKNLVRRHVLAFLQDQDRPQYLASDVIRCLKHRHKVVIADVMDTFPVAKVASSGHVSFTAMRDRFIRLEHENILNPEVSSGFRRCAAHLAHVLVGLERLGADDGRPKG